MIQAIWQSGYSANFYREVQHWRGKALAYLAMVLVLCWIPVLVQIQVKVNHGLDRVEKEIAPQIPEIRFEQGKIITPENRPYLFHIGEGTNFIGFIIDTSGQYASLEGRKEQMLLTRDRYFLRQRTGEVRTYDLSKSRARPWVLNQDAIKKIIRLLRRWVTVVLSVFIVAFSYFKRLIQAFLLALLGLALATLLETDLDLGELLSLAIVAMTPAMILETAWTLMEGKNQFAWLLWGCLILGYFLFAINSAARPTLPPENS